MLGRLADYINYSSFLSHGNGDKEYTKQNGLAVIDILEEKGNKLITSFE